MKKTIITCLMIVAGILLLPAAQAQDLDNYLKTAAENNPGLKSSYKAYEAAMQKIDQVSALPDPVLSFGYYIQPVETRVGPQKARMSLKQMFPWFGTLATKHQTAAMQAEAAFQAFIDDRNQLFFQVKSAFYQLYETDQTLEALQQHLDITNSYLDITQSKFENGRAPMVDVVRAQMEISDLETQIAVLRNQRHAEAITFNNLLNRNAADSVVVTEPTLPVPADLLAARDTLFKNNPQLMALDYKINAQQSRQKTAEKSGMPGLGLGLDYIITGKRSDVAVSGNGKDAIVPGISISIPVFRKKYKAARREAELMEESLSFKKQDKKNKLLSDYETAQTGLDNAYRKIGLFRTQLRQTQRALNLLMTAYSQDGKNFEEVLRMEQQSLKYETALATAKKQYLTALARMNYLTGNNSLQIDQK